MKRIRLLQIISIVLFLLYTALLVVEFKWEMLGANSILIFSIILAVVSLSLIWKGKLLKSTSTLWFGLSLILYAIGIIVFELLNINFDKYMYLFVLIPIISSLIILAIFSNMIYIKVIIFNISISVPIILYNTIYITWWWAVIIGLVAVLVGILISRLLSLGKEKV